MAGISFSTDSRGDRIILQLSPRKNGQEVSIQPLKPGPKFHIGVVALVLREIQQNRNLKYQPPLDSILGNAEVLLYLYPKDTRPSRDLRRIKDSIRKAWQELGRLPTIYESPQNYLLRCGPHKRQYERLLEREKKKLEETLENFFVYHAEARKTTLLGLNLEYFGLGIDDIKIEGLTELLDQYRKKEQKADETPMEKDLSDEMRWKKFYLKMKDLKNSLVFGRFPLDKIFVEPQIKNWPAFRFLDETLKENRIVVILNEFGMGKSSLCKMYASILADRYLKDASGRESVPLYIKLADFFTSDTGEEQLLKSYIEKTSRFSPEKDFLLNRSFCFLADGFDEADSYSEKEIDSNLKKLKNLSTYNDSKIVITARSGVFAHFSSVDRERLLEAPNSVCTKIEDFSEREIEVWLNNWHRRLGQEEISYSDLQNRELDQLAKNPLLLYMVANIYEDLEEKKEYKQAYVCSRFIDKTIRGKFEEDEETRYHPRFCFDTIDEYRTILQEIAYHIFLTGKAIKFEELTSLVGKRFEKSEDEKEAARSAITCHFFRGIDTGTYDFGHRVFMDYLNAERIIQVIFDCVMHSADKQAQLAAKSRICGRPVTQPIINFVRELIDMRKEEGTLRQETIKRLCSVLQSWYTCDDLLLLMDRPIHAETTEYVTLPRHIEKSLNIRVLSLMIFIYLSSLVHEDPRIETRKFSFAKFLDLCRTDMRLYQLLKKNLAFADLREASLERADLYGANLVEAKLSGVEMREANLKYAFLLRADLREAYLPEANLMEASVRQADLSEACLVGADLRKADLRGADLRKADLADANLEGAELKDADLEAADLFGANLTEISGWFEVISFKKTDISAVQGLPEKHMDYALKNGAIREE